MQAITANINLSHNNDDVQAITIDMIQGWIKYVNRNFDRASCGEYRNTRVGSPPGARIYIFLNKVRPSKTKFLNFSFLAKKSVKMT
jgi:hypothetical protein